MAKVKDENETTSVRFEWLTVAPDPIQYKPWNPTFRPLNMFIDVDIPSIYIKEVIELKGSPKPLIVLTPQGMAYASKKLATAVMSAYTSK